MSFERWGGEMVDYCAEYGVPVIGLDVTRTAPSGGKAWLFWSQEPNGGQACGEALAAVSFEEMGRRNENIFYFSITLRMIFLLDSTFLIGTNERND